MDNFRVRLLANTAESRQAGLMHTKPLEEDEVAFFVFPYADRYAFWNRNVPYKLSLAFLNDAGQIVDFADMNADDETPVAPKSHAKYVVEASHGTFKKIGASVGDVFDYKHGQLHYKKANQEHKQFDKG